MKESEAIDYLIEGEWDVDDDEESLGNFKNALDLLNSSAALHEVACCFNYDCDLDIFLTILRHPKLDKSSFLAIYWRLCPGYYQQYEAKNEIPTHEIDSFEFILEVHHRLQGASKLDDDLFFDPRNDNDLDWTEEYAEQMNKLLLQGKKPFYLIPDEFYDPV